MMKVYNKQSKEDYDEELLEKITKAFNNGSRKKDSEECATKSDIENLKSDIKSYVNDIKVSLNHIHLELDTKVYNHSPRLKLRIVMLIFFIGIVLGWCINFLTNKFMLNEWF